MANSRTDKIESEINNLAQSMVLWGITLDEAMQELSEAYAYELEETARHARTAAQKRVA